MRQQYNIWMAEEVYQLTSAGRIQCPAYSVIAQWVKTAWESIDPKMVSRSFKCCGISNARNGSEEHLIFDYDQVTMTNQRDVFYRFKEENNISNNKLGIRTSLNTASNITNNSNINDYIDFGNLEESNRDTFDSYYEDETNYVNPWHK